MRYRKIIFGTLLTSTLLWGMSFTPSAGKYFDILKSLDIFATLFKEVNAYYVEEVIPKELVDRSINGMLESLDPYTDYIAEEGLEAFSIKTTGQYAGIGALIGMINSKILITNLYHGFPANKSELMVGDEIISVDSANVEGKSASEVSTLLKGKPKTSVKLTVRRLGQKQDITVTIVREKIKLSNVNYSGMESDGIGYIKLDDFTPGAAKEVEQAVTDLKKQGATKLILDLRDNPGGLLYEAVNIVNIFIPKGQEVVVTKGKVKDWNKSYVTLNSPMDTTMPLAVLINNSSASASEIVAGALQDYDRAILIGQQTFGKGLVQTTRPLPYNAQLKITTAKYYIPSGRCIQALDYAHRHTDGSVDKFADSLKSEFLTKGGRKVYDGGGLDPDIEIKNELPGYAAAKLIISGLIFEYANVYCAKTPIPTSMRNFRISEAEYKEFITWLKSKKFEYSSKMEMQMQILMEVAKKERAYNELQKELHILKSQIDSNRAHDLRKFQDEISRVLEEEIAFHYGLIRGQVEVASERDKELLEAIRTLDEETAYAHLLSKR